MSFSFTLPKPGTRLYFHCGHLIYDLVLKTGSAVSYTHLDVYKRQIEERGDLLPKSELQEAITYLRNEWNAVVDIFNYGDTYLAVSYTHLHC